MRRVMPPAAVAFVLGVSAATVRGWRHRGVIGPVCDVRTRTVGYDLGAVSQAARQLQPRRPRGRHADLQDAARKVSV